MALFLLWIALFCTAFYGHCMIFFFIVNDAFSWMAFFPLWMALLCTLIVWYFFIVYGTFWNRRHIFHIEEQLFLRWPFFCLRWPFSSFFKQTESFRNWIANLHWMAFFHFSETGSNFSILNSNSSLDGIFLLWMALFLGRHFFRLRWHLWTATFP